MGGGGSQNISQLTLHRCACIIGKSVSCVLGLTRRNVSRYAQLYQWDLIIIVSFRLGLLSIYIYVLHIRFIPFNVHVLLQNDKGVSVCGIQKA